MLLSNSLTHHPPHPTLLHRYWTARMSDMQCLLIFPKAQPVTLLYDTNSFLPTTSGIRLGPALQVEVRATAIDWSTVKQGSAGSADVYTAVYNGGSGNATQSSVMVPVQATWVASETLLDGMCGWVISSVQCVDG